MGRTLEGEAAREPEGAAVRSLLWVSARAGGISKREWSAVPDAGKRLR